jgi:hypothetical protein
VKTAKERYWYSDISYWEETYFRDLDKRIRVPVQRTGACCQKGVQVHIYLVKISVTYFVITIESDLVILKGSLETANVFFYLL